MLEKYNIDSSNKTDGRRVNKEERRNTILDAAEQIFSSKDYHEATLDEIAEEACLSKAALYLYFENKIDLFLSMVERKLLQLGRLLRDAVVDCDDAVEAIKKLIEVELAFFSDNKEFFIIFCHQKSEIQFHVELDDEMKGRIIPIIHRKVNFIADYIRKGQESGVFQSVNSVEAAFMLTALIHTCVFMNVIKLEEDNNLLEKADLVRKIFLDGLLVRDYE